MPKLWIYDFYKIILKVIGFWQSILIVLSFIFKNRLHTWNWRCLETYFTIKTEALNSFRRTLQLRCLTRFWILLWEKHFTSHSRNNNFRECANFFRKNYFLSELLISLIKNGRIGSNMKCMSNTVWKVSLFGDFWFIFFHIRTE